MRLMREARGVFGGTDIWRKSEWVTGLLLFGSSCFHMSVVAFLRKEMGERYFGWVNLWFGYSVVAGFMFFGSLLGMFIHQPMIFPQLMWFFWVAFIAASLYQRQQIARRNNSGVEWHSMYIGTSLIPLPISREKIFKFVEPAIVFVAGHFLWNFNWEVGLWLTISAFAVAINNHIVFYNERQIILDMRDGQIEARYMSDALEGKPAGETAGLVVAESTRKLIGKDSSLQAAFSNLSTELKNLLDAAPDVKGADAA